MIVLRRSRGLRELLTSAKTGRFFVKRRLQHPPLSRPAQPASLRNEDERMQAHVYRPMSLSGYMRCRKE